MNKLELLFKSKLLKLIVSITILIYLIRFFNGSLFLQSLSRINFVWLVLALLILPLNVLIRAYSFFLIINKDNKKMSIKDTYNLSLIGAALNLFLPASSGDIAKVYFGYKSHGLKEELLSTSLFDKLTSVIAILALGVITAYWLSSYGLSLLFLALTVMLSMPLFIPRVVPWKLANKLLILLFKKGLIVERLIAASELRNTLKFKVLAVSVIGWIITYSGFFMICKMFGLKISFIYVISIAPIVTIARLFPFTLNGLGSAEAAVSYLFNSIGIKITLAITISLFFQTIYAILPGIVGYFSIFYFQGSQMASFSSNARKSLKLRSDSILEDESKSSFVIKALVYRLYQVIDEAISSFNGKKVLDVGCGQGWHLKHLQKEHRNIDFSGVDIRKDAIEIARQINPELLIKYGDIFELPFENGFFDLVIAIEVLEHLEEPDAALKEVSRVSKKYCLFTVPHEPFFRLSNLASGKYIRCLGSFPGHKQHWTPAQFRQILGNYFDDVKVKRCFPWLIALCTKSK